MKNLLQFSAVRSGILFLFLFAAQMTVPVLAADLKIHRQGEYTFIAGGVTDEEQAYLDAQAPKYPIQLIFRSAGQLEGVKDVKVRVIDIRGEAVVEAVSPGPFFFINPPASGRFTIEAELNQEKVSMTKDLVGRRYLHLVFEFNRGKSE